MTTAIKAELLSLLKWSMLAACTIGPGTVLVCSKAGADFDLELIWTLMIASFIAFVIQKEAARLTFTSGLSLGQAIRKHFQTSDSVPFAAYAVTIGVFIGNTAYTVNCFVGNFRKE